MSESIPWTKDLSVLVAGGAWGDVVPRPGQSQTGRLNTLTRLALALSGGAYLLRNDRKFLAYGAAAILAVVLLHPEGLVTQDERQAERVAAVLQKKKDSDARREDLQSEIVEDRMKFANPREAPGRGQVVPTDDQLRLGSRPLLDQPVATYESLFSQQKAGQVKFMSNVQY